MKFAVRADADVDCGLRYVALYLSSFDTRANRWRIVSGQYKVLVGPSSGNLPLAQRVRLR
jgi:hypothetical protein